MNHFERKLQENKYDLKKTSLDILQINLGKLCNLTCSHCHVEAGPTKTKENMDEKTAHAIGALMNHKSFKTVDLTGGAPEMNPHFRTLVLEARRRQLRVIDRCNLTIFFEPGMESLPQFLKENNVEIVASLPCYTQDNVDKQRGKGTFNDSIKALQWLNDLGYGKDGSGLILNLVYNPVGPYLPGAQDKLQSDYKKQLQDNFGIVFNKLFTITNMPITRWAKYLKALNQLDVYQELLMNNFNSATLDGLMCRNTLSVSYDGRIFDCDFNQQLNMQIKNGPPLSVFNIDLDGMDDLKILTADHCFGCTAGAGSSCQGAIHNSVNIRQMFDNQVDD